MHKVVPRLAWSTLIELADTFPIVAINGPRQSGKTTLARTAYPDKPYVSLEDPDIREAAISDPRAFLDSYLDGAIFDKAQRVPELFSYLQGIVDKDRANGRFILTGSHQFLLDQSISQSLAGRVGYLKLLPLSQEEVPNEPNVVNDLNRIIWRGLYPSTAIHNASPRLWYGSYVETYLERDVRQMINIRDLSSFQRFLRLCAGRSGSLLDVGGLGNEASLDYKTVKSWLSVLEASYIIHLLKPYHHNYNKRLVKTPKLYFLDTGLASWLLGIKEFSQLESHPLRGNLFETLIVSEILKLQYNQAEPANLYFWRDSNKNEVDLLLDQDTESIAIEIKSGKTFHSTFLKGLDYWKRLDPDKNKNTFLVYTGDDTQKSKKGHAITNWENLSKALKK